MARKRKRQHQSHERDTLERKRARHQDFEDGRANAVGQRLLPHYYPEVQTLGEYLERRLEHKSKFDRRLSKLDSSDDVYQLLKTTLVGTFKASRAEETAMWTRGLQDFTQKSGEFMGGSRRTSGGLPGSRDDGASDLSDVVDFAIWHLFMRTHKHAKYPPHLLCNGFQRMGYNPEAPAVPATVSGIEGLITLRANAQVDRIKGADWCQLSRILGDQREQIMLELIFRCGIFLPLRGGTDNFIQLSGVSLADLPLLEKISKTSLVLQQKNGAQPAQAKPLSPRLASNIAFVRNKMFYARATLHGKGEVYFGLRHIHVLNRCPDVANDEQTTHVMKYMFPRQFGLHNVFTSQIERKTTSHPFQDYSLRENEIAAGPSRYKNKLPKRLRGDCFNLVKKMRILHKRCAYTELLKHYCIVEDFDKSCKIRNKGAVAKMKSVGAAPRDGNFVLAKNIKNKDIVDLASPTAHVSAFVRAVIKNLVPADLLGMGEESKQNWRILFRYIDQFIDGKRFENISLGAVCQGMKIKSIVWLQPPGVAADGKISQSDYLKRTEMLQELVYYMFDSLVIPVVRSCFHVTESSDHRNRLFYFRHDVWRVISEPAMTRIKTNIYQDLPAAAARKILDARPLGYSNLRLLPKKDTARPIVNLRRRVAIKKYGKTYLGASVNATLKNAFTMLNYEKLRQPELLGSAMFSNNELYPRLVEFKKKLAVSGQSDLPLYFVKVDVQACFDTIPQEALMQLVDDVCRSDRLVVKHHAQVKASPFSRDSSMMDLPNSNPSRKFKAHAHAQLASQSCSFPETVEERYACEKRGTVFIEGSMQSYVESENVLDVLDDHVRRNIVRIGKKYFRQKNGIAQGSVVSSILCSFFYGDFERKKLSFLQSMGADRGAQCMLLRLIDDFLLITTQREAADKFLRTMLAGDQQYGISVRPEKTLANFTPTPSSAFGHEPTVSNPASKFPWCGMWIDTKTLSLTRDRTKHGGTEDGRAACARRKRRRGRTGTDLADLITVEAVRRPGSMFYHKTMSSIKLNVRNMYTDTNMADSEQVERELSSGFAEAAQRAVRYLSRLRGLAHGQEIKDEVIKRTIEDAGKLANVLTRNRQSGNDYRCDIGRERIELLMTGAFMQSLQKRQTRYRDVLAWLQEREATLR